MENRRIERCGRGKVRGKDSAELADCGWKAGGHLQLDPEFRSDHPSFTCRAFAGRLFPAWLIVVGWVVVCVFR